MAEVTAYPPGSFCFIEAGCPDIRIASGFYTALFGWEAQARSTPNGATYTRFLKRGKPVAGMYLLDEGQEATGIPLSWISYVSVQDAAATSKRAVEAGATLLGDLIEVPGVVTVAEFADPAGAVCGLWQSHGHIGAAFTDEPGTMIWNELLTDNPVVAATFYRAVFDWTHEVVVKPTGPYHLFKDRDSLRGGMIATNPQTGEGPPSWRAHIAVGDINASIAEVADLGGTVEGSAIDISGVGRAVEIRDPAGVSFMVMEQVAPLVP